MPSAGVFRPAMKQRTILREVTTHGRALHTGKEVTLTLQPAEPDTGIVFRRVDLYGRPEMQPRIDLVDKELVRSTDLTEGHMKLQTIEHVLSALYGCGVDNCVVELNAEEPPILDGSAGPYATLIQKAEPVDQDAERLFFEVREPVSISEGNRSIIALPHDGLRITCTSADDRGIHTQHLSLDIDAQTYLTDIASARTFTIYEDIEPLLKMGKIQGGSLDSAIVIRGNQILSKEPLRFEDEFVRHKMLDIIGDLALLGRPFKGHIVAVRPGHKLNAQLTKALRAQEAPKALPPTLEPARKRNTSVRKTIAPEENVVMIRRILDLMPHAYPFVLIDRVVGFEGNEALTAIKNVTINEPFFVGHFPGNPVMPGVLQLEAMCQAAGMLMLRQISSDGKMALFLSADKVKFRRAVVPGDQLSIRVELKKTRGTKLAAASGTCSVDGKVVSSADLMFTVVDVPEEGT